MKEQTLIGWGWGPPGYLPQLFVKYRLNSDDFERFWVEQDGKCAGCRQEFAHPRRKEMRTGLKCEVDHKHYAGKQCEKEDVRGLLCRRCNDFLGKIQDNHDTLQNLLDYIKRKGGW